MSSEVLKVGLKKRFTRRGGLGSSENDLKDLTGPNKRYLTTI